MSEVLPGMQSAGVDVVALNDALDELQTSDPRAAELVKRRFFAGLARRQAASVLGVSVATADNVWAYAKGWLRLEMAGASGNSLQSENS